MAASRSLHATERGAELAGRGSMALPAVGVVKGLVVIAPAHVGFDSRQVAGHPVEASIDRIEPVIGALLAVLTGTELHCAMKQVTLTTDGACIGNPSPGGWAYILRYGEHDVRKVDTAPTSPAPVSRSSLLRHSSFIRAVCVDALARICVGGGL